MDIPTIEDFARLEKKMDLILSRLGASDNVVTIKDLAARYKCSYNYIKYTAPYLMPNNGKSDFTGGVIKWHIQTLEEWEKIPVDERRSAWETEQRNKALNKARR